MTKAPQTQKTMADVTICDMLKLVYKYKLIMGAIFIVSIPLSLYVYSKKTSQMSTLSTIKLARFVPCGNEFIGLTTCSADNIEGILAKIRSTYERSIDERLRPLLRASTVYATRASNVIAFYSQHSEAQKNDALLLHQKIIEIMTEDHKRAANIQEEHVNQFMRKFAARLKDLETDPNASRRIQLYTLAPSYPSEHLMSKQEISNPSILLHLFLGTFLGLSTGILLILSLESGIAIFRSARNF